MAALLTKEKRKKYFEYLGLGKYNKTNIKKFQKIAFSNPKEHDGDYGPHTDTALRHWYNVKKYTKNFRPEEFKCGCGGRYCTGYPDRMKAKELKHIQTIRDHYGKPITITSGLRCRTFNAQLRGSSPSSRHMTGYALDFYIPGVTGSLEGRKKAIQYIKTLKNHDYTYCDGWDSNGSIINRPNMGNAIHSGTK